MERTMNTNDCKKQKQYTRIPNRYNFMCDNCLKHKATWWNWPKETPWRKVWICDKCKRNEQLEKMIVVEGKDQPMSDINHFGEIMHKYRISKRVTLREIYEKTMIKISVLSDMEHGRTQILPFQIGKIQKAIDEKDQYLGKEYCKYFSLKLTGEEEKSKYENK